MMDESSFRRRMDDVFKRIDAAFENVDPDLAESEYSQGALTITFRQTSKLILSPQTPLRQIWVAFRDRAWHLDMDETKGQWRDDRGQDVELCSLVTKLASEQAGVTIRIPPASAAT